MPPDLQLLGLAHLGAELDAEIWLGRYAGSADASDSASISQTNLRCCLAAVVSTPAATTAPPAPTGANHCQSVMHNPFEEHHPP